MENQFQCNIEMGLRYCKILENHCAILKYDFKILKLKYTQISAEGA